MTFAVNRRNVPLTMEAKLDASHNSLEGYDWTRQASLKAERKLQCTVTSMQNPNSGNENSRRSHAPIPFKKRFQPHFQMTDHR